MSAPSLSVIVPALDAARHLDDLLTCLAGQDEDTPAFEVIISDNGSRDRTREVALAWSDRLDLRVVDSSARRGAAFARNNGALFARSASLAFCDADDLVSSNWVTTMAAALRPRSLVAGPIIRAEPDARPLTSITSPYPPANCSDSYPYMNFLPCVMSGSMAIHREDFIGLGGFDNSYGPGCEDVDFSWRAQLSGMTLQVAHGCALYYRRRTTAGEVFRAERGYNRPAVLLWQRFKEYPQLSAGSFRWSVTAAVRTLARVRPNLLWSADDRYAWAKELGAYLGSVEGHLRYRRRPVPGRELLLPVEVGRGQRDELGEGGTAP